MTELVDQTIAKLRAGGMRKTKALVELVRTLAEHERPMTLADLCGAKRLSNLCDKATVFRLLQKMVDQGVVRRLGLHQRAAYFVLLDPANHSDYLICTACGTIKPIDAPCPVHHLEDEIRQKSGFTDLYHELEFFGVCPKCS